MIDHKYIVILKFKAFRHGIIFIVVFFSLFVVGQNAKADFASSTGATTTAIIQSAPQYGDGALIRGSGPEIYLITSEATRRWIKDEVTFKILGYNWPDVVVTTNEELGLYPLGADLDIQEVAAKVPTLAESEKMVRSYFADIPVMIDVAKCESGFRQFKDDGTVVKAYGLYIGVFQIDEKIHAEYAKSLGMDIYTLPGNLAYARRLYEQRGLAAWPVCSKTARGYKFTHNLSQGDTDSEVKVLQQLLNELGFTVAESGVGSVGNETEYFGSLTKQAVQRFQCKKGIACSGSEFTTGYGLVGPKTRAALLRAI
ncbi:MAG: peptidoglycan-binding protein [Patescibacteria group bacterium]|jgi:hypothetical protein|nr:peptidoglycan-binding protein [Patescibacteria group bacterium]